MPSVLNHESSLLQFSATVGLLALDMIGGVLLAYVHLLNSVLILAVVEAGCCIISTANMQGSVWKLHRALSFYSGLWKVPGML